MQTELNKRALVTIGETIFAYYLHNLGQRNNSKPTRSKGTIIKRHQSCLWTSKYICKTFTLSEVFGPLRKRYVRSFIWASTRRIVCEVSLLGLIDK